MSSLTHLAPRACVSRCRFAFEVDGDKYDAEPTNRQCHPCHERGACAAGVCECDVYYTGATCERVLTYE